MKFSKRKCRYVISVNGYQTKHAFRIRERAIHLYSMLKEVSPVGTEIAVYRVPVSDKEEIVRVRHTLIKRKEGRFLDE